MVPLYPYKWMDLYGFVGFCWVVCQKLYWKPHETMLLTIHPILWAHSFGPNHLSSDVFNHLDIAHGGLRLWCRKVWSFEVNGNILQETLLCPLYYIYIRSCVIATFCEICTSTYSIVNVPVSSLVMLYFVHQFQQPTKWGLVSSVYKV